MFGNKKKKEEDLRIKVIEWWRKLKYFDKLEILLARGTKADGDGYPSYNISSIEDVGIRTFWGYNTLEQKIEIMQKWEKEKGGKK